MNSNRTLRFFTEHVYYYIVDYATRYVSAYRNNVQMLDAIQVQYERNIAIAPEKNLQLVMSELLQY